MSEQSSDSKILVFLASNPQNPIANFTFENYKKNIYFIESIYYLEKAKNPDISTEVKNDFLTQAKDKFSLTYFEDNISLKDLE